MEGQNCEFKRVAEGIFEDIKYFSADCFSKGIGCDSVHVKGCEDIDVIVEEHLCEKVLYFASEAAGEEGPGSVEDAGDCSLEHYVLCVLLLLCIVVVMCRCYI